MIIAKACGNRCFLFLFYIKSQQAALAANRNASCFLFLFYIKSQPLRQSFAHVEVVSYFFSTSNHNLKMGT